MPQGELVNDHQRDRFRSGQKAPQRIRVATERIRGAFAMREAAVRGVQVLPGPVGLDWRAIEVPGLEFIEAGFDQNRYLPTVQAMSIVCRVRRRRVPSTRACTRPRAVSATGRDGSLLSTCAAFAVDSAWRAKTNNRNTSAGILGLLPLVHSASKGQPAARSGMHAPDIVKGGIIEPRTFRAAHRNHADVRCTTQSARRPM